MKPVLAPTKTAEGLWSGRVTSRLCLSLLAFAVLVTGCGSNSALVKQPMAEKTPLSGSLASTLSGGSSKAPAATPKLNKYPSIPMEENAPRVRRFIRQYAYESRETMKKYLARADEHLPMVKSVAREHGLPVEIAYLFMLESGANPEARSPANALGMWQFMPATARSYGLRVDSWVDERLDPVKSTRAAMLYLKDLYGMFGCWRLALSAYNSGENKLNKVLCKEDADEYEEISTSRYLRRETKEFWPKFQAIAQIANSPEKFGFKPLNGEPYRANYEVVPVEGNYSLTGLAQLCAVEPDELCSRNPALIRGITPNNGSEYPVRVPPGKKAALIAALRSAPSDAADTNLVHVVHRGENLARILRRYGVNKDQVATLNPDVNLKRKLKPGEKILIPVQQKALKKTPQGRQQISSLK